MNDEPRLRTDVTGPDDGVAVITIVGEVTPASEDELMAAWGRTGDARAVVLDLGGLEYMNSGGIGLLVAIVVRAQRADRRLLAFGLSEHYQQIFTLTRLDEVITLAQDRTDALAAAARDRPSTNGT